MDIIKVLENTISALIGTDAAYFALAAIGLNVQFGYTGLLNFGQAAFMACGAYGLGMTSQYFGVGMWWGILIGLIYVVVLGILVGIPTLRLRSDYLAIVTIATAEIVRLVDPRLAQTMAEAVALEKDFIRDCLPLNGLGLSSKEFTPAMVTDLMEFPSASRKVTLSEARSSCPLKPPK